MAQSQGSVRPLDVEPEPSSRFGPMAAVTVVVLAAGFLTLGRLSDTVSTNPAIPAPATVVVAPTTERSQAPDAQERPSNTPPDAAEELPVDGSTGPLPLGVVSELPGEDYLNFLIEFCWPECYQGTDIMAADDPQVKSGVWTAGRRFFVHRGFINTGDDSLGDGFEVDTYLTRWSGPYPAGSTFATAENYGFTSGDVLSGMGDESCGSRVGTTTPPETCRIIDDVPGATPEGRYDLWAVWEGPCAAWADLGFTDTCDDPNEIISLFSSGVHVALS